MKSIVQLSGSRLGGSVLCAASLLLMPVATQAANKVRVMVTENQGKAITPSKDEKTPAKPQNGVKPATNPAAIAKEKKEEQYTHSSSRSLTIALANTTKESIDVTVKTSFLAKDEGGSHEISPDKTLESKVTLEPGKSQEFTTEDVTFTHTSAHRTTVTKGKPVNVPASGKQYVGYKVEVYAGNDLVGSDTKSGGF